ncbi:MAG: phosphate propanoyltransferase [Candidatus Aenigmarchaeota archaeon]|nr:phosphate propanoyltransferase [Candidatus Aenigmarchaeota archaeon]
MKTLIEISARHIHLSARHLTKLFGKNYQLKSIRSLSQPNQFVSQAMLTIKTSKLTIKKVRILGPLRRQTQVEISRSDAYRLGINPPLRISGDLKGSASVILIGPKGKIRLSEGVIVAQRHLHITSQQANQMGINRRRFISIQITGPRALIFQRVSVRISKQFSLVCHLDTDEGNSAGINRRGHGKIILK